MKFSLIPATNLDTGLLNRWMEIRSQNLIYDSPYYHPAFTMIAARARKDARILLCEQDGQLIGIWPFHRLNAFSAESIGGFLSDYHGPVCLPGLELPFSDVLKAMQCRYLAFNHLPEKIGGFKRFSWGESQSHFLDLQGGFEAYAQRISEMRDASVLKKVATNERKLSKKYGTLRFELHSASGDDYHALLAGKSEQFRRTVGEAHDIFKISWVRQVMDEIRRSDGADFAGLLSTLHAGDTLIAAHFGMRSQNVLHYWFPWYRTDYAEYSPGLILLAQCARHAPQSGITLIDLGRGDQAYKLRFSTGANRLCEGAISSPALLGRVRAGLYYGKRYLKQSGPGQCLRQLRHAGQKK